MPIRYACFISYPNGVGTLVKRFVTDLKKVLGDQIDAWQDEGVFLDKARLGPGTKIGEGIARAICQSVCMIVVYSPKYQDHPYCRREYMAFEQLEAKRRALIRNPELRDESMIIPVIFRGKKYLPAKLKNIGYLDFENYMTPRTSIEDNDEYVLQLANTAEKIYAMFREIKESNADVCSDCDEFKLPTEEQAVPWSEPREQVLPTR